MNDRLTELAYTVGWKAARTIPEPVARTLFRWAADRAYTKNGAGVKQLRHNLRRVVGPQMSQAELNDLTKDALRSYSRYWLEAFRLPNYSKTEIDQRFYLHNWEVLKRHREEGKGVLLALCHSGNWDLAGAWTVGRGLPVTTVAQRLKPEGVFQRFVEFRRKLGMEILPHTGGERAVYSVLVDRLRQRNIVPLLADRDLSNNGIEVDFFGEKTRMPAGPALLAIRTNSPLYTVVLRNDGPRHCVGTVEGPIEIPDEGRLAGRISATTQLIADAFAKGIAAHPADWHMLQRLWLTDMDHA